MDAFRSFRNLLTICVAVAVLATMSVNIAFAGAGDLDLTFGDGGKVITDTPRASWISQTNRLTPSVVQPDGKILVAAGARLWRLNFDGSLDQGFGSNGEANTGGAFAQIVELQPDGKIIVGFVSGFRFGNHSGDWGLARFLNDGSFDSSFGDGGILTADFGATAGDYYDGNSHEIIEGIFVQDDGRILLAGSIINGPGLGGGIGLMMFRPDGKVDPTFGQSGRVFINPDAVGTLAPAVWSWLSPLRIAEQADGKLILASVATSVQDNDTVYLARLNRDGSPDMSFGQNGTSIYVKDTFPYFRLGQITIGSDGSILVLASLNIGGRNNNPSLLAFNADGTFDGSFGNAGVATVDLSVFGDDPPSFDLLALNADGGTILGGTRVKYGWSSDGTVLYYYNDLVALKLKPDASIDEIFGTSGMVAISLSDHQRELYAKSINLLDDGSIVMAGPINHFPRGTSQFPSDDIAVVRLNSDGSADFSFGIGGKSFVTTHEKSNDGAQDVVLSQADGKIVVAGYHWSSDTGQDFKLTRHNSDGSLDMTFGINGHVTTDLRSSYDSTTQWAPQHVRYHDLIRAIALQPDGKIVAAGNSTLVDTHKSGASFALARYDDNGELDSGFGEDGKVFTDFLPEVDFEPEAAASGIALQSDGKMVVVGFAKNRPGGGPYEYEMAIARYNSDGTLDAAFGNNGQVTIDRFPGYDEWASALALQADGKILLVGSYAHHHFWIDDDGLQLVRLNTDGSLDMSFGDAGVVTTSIGKHEEMFDIEVQQDGRIVVGGVTFLDETNYDMLLVRYQADGNLDASFGFNGYVSIDFGDNLPGALPNGTEEINSLELQSDGRIVAAGYTGRWIENPVPREKHLHPYIPSYDFALLRFEMNGSLDYSFGYGGKVTTLFGNSYNVGWSAGIQTDGKILVVGETAKDVTPYDLSLYLYDFDTALARYEGVNSSLDEIEALVFHTQNLVSTDIVNEGQANALQSKLRAAVQQTDRGNHNAAIKQLGSFVNQVSALMLNDVIPGSEAEFLIMEAEALITLISN